MGAVEAGVQHVRRHDSPLPGDAGGNPGGIGVQVTDADVLGQKAVLSVGQLLPGDQPRAVLVGAQLGGDGPPVGGHRGHHHDLSHLEVPHLVPYGYDLSQTLVAQDAVGGQTADLHIVDIRGAGGDQQGADDPVKACGLGRRLLHPSGLTLGQVSECSHRTTSFGARSRRWDGRFFTSVAQWGPEAQGRRRALTCVFPKL